jgi:hypothetical protein
VRSLQSSSGAGGAVDEADGEGDEEDACEGGVAETIEEVEDLVWLGGTGLAFEFALIGFAGVEEEERVAGGGGVEDDEAVGAAADLASEGAEDGDFFGAWGAEVFLEEGAAGVVHQGALAGDDFGGIGGGFCGWVDAAEGETVDFAVERLGEMGGGVGGGEVDGVAEIG